MGLVFLVGEPAGGKVLRAIIKDKVKHRPIQEIKPQMCYLQYYMWKILMGFGDKTVFDIEHDYEKCPMFFAYGTKKAFMFHEDNWLRNLMQIEKEHPDRVRVEAFKCDHWVSVNASKEYSKSLIKWLDDTKNCK